MDITIYHNPRCGTSRNTLAAIREAGHEPQVIEYLANPPGREQLARLIADAGLQPRDAVRRKEALYAELGLDRDTRLRGGGGGVLDRRVIGVVNGGLVQDGRGLEILAGGGHGVTTVVLLAVPSSAKALGQLSHGDIEGGEAV